MKAWNRQHKYKAQPVIVDGRRFPSKKEAARYRELSLMERAGEIEQLHLQPTFAFKVNDQLICRYRADFKYFEPFKRAWIVEDVKGFKTPEYRIKAKLFRVLFPEFVFLET